MTTDPVETLRDAFRLELDLAYGPDPHNAVVARALIEVAALDSLVAERDRLDAALETCQSHHDELIAERDTARRELSDALEDLEGERTAAQKWQQRADRRADRMVELGDVLEWAISLVEAVNDPSNYDRTLGQQLDEFPARAREALGVR